ncbi:Transducin (beta)-like 3 [Bulinus truncatus]|nr:Transducin (beta)-like 3 [Bulinus truncatus]
MRLPSELSDVRVINAETGKREYSNSCRLSDPDVDSKTTDSYIIQALYSTDLNGIILATYDENIILLSKDFTIEKQLCGHLDEILSLHFLGENDTHVAVATNTDLLKVFNRETWECQMLQGHSDIITSLDVKSNFIVSGSKDSSIRVWQLSADVGFVTCLAVGQGHTQAVQCVALSRASARPHFILSGGVDMTLKVWAFPVEADVVAPHMTLRVSCTEHAHDKDINCLSVAPNDRIVATGSQDKTAKLWTVGDNLQSISLLAVLRGHKRGIWCVKFSPVDQIVATSSGDGYIKMWNVTDYSCVRTLEGHDSSVLSFSFLSHGRQILSCGSDGLLKLWLIKTSECLKTFEGHDAKVWALSVSTAEDYVLSGGADSTLILWKDITEQEQLENQEKLQKQVMQEQVLSNLIADKKFVRAMGLAISLNKPYRALNIMKEVMKQENGIKQLEKLVCKLRIDQIESVLKFAVEWNTNSRNYFPAQQLLNIILRNYLPQDLVKLPGIQSVVEGFCVYTDRHLQRLNNLLIDSHFAEYCYSCMKTSS